MTPIDTDAIRQLTARWGLERGVFESNAKFENRCASPEFHQRFRQGKVPTLSLEDVSGIPFVSVIPGVEMYQHRARVRASNGDVFATSTPLPAGYEDYNREILHLGAPTCVIAEPVENPAASISACMQGTAYKQIVEWGKAQSSIAIHPYMSIEPAWELAARLGVDAGVETRVIGPPPAALWIANDKWALTEIIRLVASENLVVESAASTQVETIARHLQDFAKRHGTVGLKRTRCASAMGNRVFESHELNRLNLPEITALVRDFLAKTEWQGDEEVIVVEWIETDLSPSTQTWIPPQGPPIIEGVYEQLLEGREKVFLGSRPSTLPTVVNQALIHASMIVATAFQALGYVGRCSFDFVVGGDVNGEFEAKFTECNGRWGGTSTPMFLVDRVMGTDIDTRPTYLAQDFIREDLVGASFMDIREAIEDLLYRPETGEGRFILYNVGPLAGSGKFDIISLGRNADEALEGVHKILPARLGVR